ncbi:MAG: chorismate mutase [Candidatus Bathyarchaeia archaeon]
MESIIQLRKRIDAIDEQILQLLSERVDVCRLIGALKRRQNMPVKDVPRENDVYSRIKRKAAELGLDAEQVEVIYRQIVNMCSLVQEMEERLE